MAAAVTAAVPAICTRCGAQNYKGSLFCDACRVYLRDGAMQVERATYNRRFWGDYLLEGVLFVVTLGLGWIIWFIFTSKTGQTPAKRLLNTYAINIETGRNIGRGDSWLREVVVKWLAIGIANGFTSGLFGLLDMIWLFFDKDRQTLHDKVLKQVIVYAPAGLPEDMQHMELAPPRFQAPALSIPGTTAASPAQPHVSDVAGDLRELQRLKDEGLINDEEYEKKRAELVERM